MGYVFSCTYIPMIKFSLSLSYCRTLSTVTNNWIEQLTISCSESSVNVVIHSLSKYLMVLYSSFPFGDSRRWWKCQTYTWVCVVSFTWSKGLLRSVSGVPCWSLCIIAMLSGAACCQSSETFPVHVCFPPAHLMPFLSELSISQHCGCTFSVWCAWAKLTRISFSFFKFTDERFGLTVDLSKLSTWFFFPFLIKSRTFTFSFKGDALWLPSGLSKSLESLLLHLGVIIK